MAEQDVSEGRVDLLGCRRRRSLRTTTQEVTAVVKADRATVEDALYGIEELSRSRQEQRASRRGRRGSGVDVGHHVHITAARRGVVASYPLEPGAGPRPIGPWVAYVILRSNGAATTVTVKLLCWSEAGGAVQNLDQYHWFLKALATRLRAVDVRTRPVPAAAATVGAGA